jgi:hypothetical protein
MFRNEFAQAKQKGDCGRAAGALERLKSVVGAQADQMAPRTRNIAFRELLSKQSQVQACVVKAQRRAAERTEDAESNRFNGLLGLGILGIL